MDLATASLDVMERHWQPDLDYTAPNSQSYPFQWLWDSCFHAVIWAWLDRPDRAVTELRTVFRWQTPSGFVPHMGYQRDPLIHADFWGVEGRSTITQPPMYGHAIAALRARGVEVPAELVERAIAGLRWLARNRLRDKGFVVLCHPWESGFDDSPAWDAWCPGGYDRARWRVRKGDLVRSLVLDDEGAGVANPDFEVATPGFQALVVFNMVEVGLDPSGLGLSMPRVPECPRTIDDLLPVLLDGRRGTLALALDPSAFGGPCGPAATRRDDPTFDPHSYWRGPAWPPLTYLLWLAARRHGHSEDAAALARCLHEGAMQSGLAEYWHPDTGAPLGAVPQAWAALAAAVDTGDEAA
jgi:hypothetical protein